MTNWRILEWVHLVWDRENSLNTNTWKKKKKKNVLGYSRFVFNNKVRFLRTGEDNARFVLVEIVMFSKP